MNEVDVGFGDMTAGMGVKMLFDGQRKTKPILTCELVPKSTWAKNLRTRMGQDLWDIARKIAYKKARYRCEVCSGKGPKWPVECHESWTFDSSTRIQTLNKLISLCPSCHAVKHWGFSRTQGREDECRDHIAFVNGWTPEEITEHVAQVFAIWKQRSRVKWVVKLGNLTRFGLSRDHIAGLHRGHSDAKVDLNGYAGPEDEPWDSIPEDCL